MGLYEVKRGLSYVAVYVLRGGLVGKILSSETGRKGFKFLGVLPMKMVLACK